MNGRREWSQFSQLALLIILSTIFVTNLHLFRNHSLFSSENMQSSSLHSSNKSMPVTRHKRALIPGNPEYEYFRRVFAAADAHQGNGDVRSYDQRFIHAVRTSPIRGRINDWGTVVPGWSDYPSAIAGSRQLLNNAYTSRARQLGTGRAVSSMVVDATRCIPAVEANRLNAMNRAPAVDNGHIRTYNSWVGEWDFWHRQYNAAVLPNPAPAPRPYLQGKGRGGGSGAGGGRGGGRGGGGSGRWIGHPPGGCIGPASGRRKRATRPSTDCAFIMSPDGQVRSVHPNEFLEHYKATDPEGKQIMADTARGNRDKLASSPEDTRARKKVDKLVLLEKAKSHAATVTTVDKIQKSPKSSPKTSTISPHVVAKGMMNYLMGHQSRLVRLGVKVKLSGTKISQGLSRMATSKFSRRFSKGVGKVAGPLGYFFMAKTIIRGIKDGDATTLSIVAGRVGLDMGGMAARNGGKALVRGVSKVRKFVPKTKVFSGMTKALSTATKLGKAMKFIGEYAGPVGAAADIGLSVWSLTKSVERLNNSTNRYIRNDAIADIVQDSISIVVTATVTTVSIAFPPAAPIAIAIGFVADIATMITVGIFKAANHVARIDSEIKLLDFEKAVLFKEHLFDWFGTRKPNYIDVLVNETLANDVAVQHNVDFLKNNSRYSGIVFPSRTLHYEGSCTFTARPCTVDVLGGCLLWGAHSTLGDGCDMNRRCANYYYYKVGNYEGKCEDWGHSDERLCACRTEKTRLSDLADLPILLIRIKDLVYLDCQCRGVEEEKYSEPRKNSLVNFRDTERVYWERAVPKDVKDATFKCKPGSLKYEGFTVSEQNPHEQEYLCKNAIGILHPGREGKEMLFDLEDGDDTVILGHETTPNIFQMGNDGVKDYQGGGGENEFLFGGNCSKSLQGSFSGGSGGNDRIVVGEDCAKGQEIKVDFEAGHISSGSNIGMDFHGIEEFYGRIGQPEEVVVSCQTTTVTVGGVSSSGQPDQVFLRQEGCSYNVTVIGENFTDINSSADKGDMFILLGKTWTGTKITADLYPELQMNILFSATSSSHIMRDDFERHLGRLKMSLESDDQQDIRLDFPMKSGRNMTGIQFKEEPEGSPNSELLLMDAKDAFPFFYHSLPDISSSPRRRVGCPVIRNIFEMTASGWSAVGGNKNDEFILLYTGHVSMIVGGEDYDTFQLAGTYSSHLSVDLGSQQYRSIEQVNGVPGVPITVTTACDTEKVSGEGGSEDHVDLIIVPQGHCAQRTLNILAPGYTHVKVEGGRREFSERDIARVAAHGENLHFELTTTATDVAHLSVAILVQHKNWTVASAEVDILEGLVRVRMEEMVATSQGKDWVKLNLVQNTGKGVTTDGPYFEAPYIQMFEENSDQVSGVMVFDRKLGSPKIRFQLDGADMSVMSSTVNGFMDIENIFYLATSATKWEAVGGQLSDQFFLRLGDNDGGQYYVDGGAGTDNTLYLGGDEDAIDRPFLVNLAGQDLGYVATIPAQRGTVDRIQHVIGRLNSPDVIHPTCDTKTVESRGGRGPDDQSDQINIRSNRCQQDLLISVGPFTQVRNVAVKGDFTYMVEDIATSSLELKPTRLNSHLVQFLFHPWEFISAVAFDGVTETMGWKISEKGVEKRIQTWKMSRDLDAVDYNNPTFEFTEPGSSVVSEIRVSTNMVTSATFIVRGLENPDIVLGLPVDVNMFMVNVARTSEENYTEPRGEIQGCADGTRCSANQFWIFNLTASLAILDGGGNETSNQLYFASNYNIDSGRRLHVFMNTQNGSVKTDSNQIVIQQLRSIHKLQGKQNITAHVSCDTKQVTGVDQVVINVRDCPLEMVIELETCTGVWFENDDMDFGGGGQDNAEILAESQVGEDIVNFEGSPSDADQWNDDDDYWVNFEGGTGEPAVDSDMDASATDEDFKYNYQDATTDDPDAEADSVENSVISTIHYRFARPMSFDPKGSLMAIIQHQHTYFLPFTLNMLTELYFDRPDYRLFYTLNGTKYNHSMFLLPGYMEQFYSEPNMVTEDGYRIQVARDGAVWAVMGNAETSEDTTADDLPELQETANMLGVTMIIQNPHTFFYIGHSATVRDRNVVNNIAGLTCHLTGGGVDSTIYEVVSLDADVFVYTGFTEDTLHAWNGTMKQTIDLTDVVVPIRVHSETKYVPKVNMEENNLVIWMEGYEQIFPGKVTIVRGGYPWVAQRLQLLLNNAMMDFIPVQEIRRKRSMDEENRGAQAWKIAPRPVLIPEDIAVYSLAAEDLEDGQEIRREGSAANDTSFKPMRNGTDLYLTNILDMERAEAQTVIVTDVYEASPHLEYRDHTQGVMFEKRLPANESYGVDPLDFLLPMRMSDVKFHLPGLDLMLNSSGLVNMITEGGGQVNVTIWLDELAILEEQLLTDMPDAERVFQAEGNDGSEYDDQNASNARQIWTINR